MRISGKSPTPQSINLLELQPFCREVRFAQGDVLREKGQHYKDMYVIADGAVQVDRQTNEATRFITLGSGSPIGEIGFLRGSPAVATVTATTPVEALFIDDATLASLEREQPMVATHLLRRLGEIAEERTSYNLVSSPIPARCREGHSILVYLCRNKELLERAQRLRYEVYCQELGRQSPYADQERRIISDELDAKGHTFVALEAGEAIGTVRANTPSEGPLGVLEDLYGMRSSPYHPDGTAVCTKFIVKKAKRGGPAAMKLIQSVLRYGLRHGIRECYIDCIPTLLPYYKAIGFTIAGGKFLHRENGPSIPMKLDLIRHGEQLSNGQLNYLNFLLKAQIIRSVDKVRGAFDLS